MFCKIIYFSVCMILLWNIISKMKQIGENKNQNGENDNLFNHIPLHKPMIDVRFHVSNLFNSNV